MENSILSQEEETLLNQVLEGESTNPDNSNKLPVNSPTATINTATSRFSGALWYDEMQRQSIVLVGAGGIGSHLALLLERLYIKDLFIYDSDTIDETNMSGQLYPGNSVGRSKAYTIADIIKDFCPATANNIYAVPYSYYSNGIVRNIMIGGVDNMDARRLVFGRWISHIDEKTQEERSKCLLIDGRLSPDAFQVFAIQGNDERAIKEYNEKWLFSDEEADATLCSFKQTTYMASMIASTMANVLVNFVANMCNPIMERAVPFLIQYDSDNMFTKTQL